MADFQTVTELLIAQPERKLNNLRAGIMAEIQRLSMELKFVEEALQRKRSRAVVRAGGADGQGAPKANGGRPDGLPRAELLQYMRDIGESVSPTELREFLESKGITKTTEAMRTALLRLDKAGTVRRTPDGKFALPTPLGIGTGTESQTDLSRQPTLSDGYPSGASDG